MKKLQNSLSQTFFLNFMIFCHRSNWMTTIRFKSGKATLNSRDPADVDLLLIWQPLYHPVFEHTNSLLPASDAEKPVHASRLDYCNELSGGFPASSVNKLALLPGQENIIISTNRIMSTLDTC